MRGVGESDYSLNAELQFACGCGCLCMALLALVGAGIGLVFSLGIKLI